jgi:hypothetical protein
MKSSNDGNYRCRPFFVEQANERASVAVRVCEFSENEMGFRFLVYNS